jgi:hypothetical protein
VDRSVLAHRHGPTRCQVFGTTGPADGTPEATIIGAATADQRGDQQPQGPTLPPIAAEADAFTDRITISTRRTTRAACARVPTATIKNLR